MRLAALHTLLALSLLAGAPHGCGGTGDDDDDDDDDTTLPPADDNEREPNDTTTQANRVSIGQTLRGSMEPGDRDVFQIDVPADYADYKLSIAVEDAGRDCFAGTDPNLEILAADGRTRLRWMEDSVEDYCPRMELVVEPGQRYYAAIGTQVGLSGEYTLTLSAGGTGTVSGTVSSGEVSRATGPAGAARREVIGPIREGEMLIQLEPGSRFEVMRPALERVLEMPVEPVRPVMGGRYQLVRVTVPASLEGTARRAVTLELIGRAGGLPGVVRVEPNRVLSPQKTVNDPYFDQQWDFGAFPGMNTQAAWDLWPGSSATVVAVIDTGNDPNHSDLEGKAVAGYDFITEPDSSGDGDGPDPDPDDNIGDGHGTHVAGTVAAGTNNATGVAGVGFDVAYMPLRVCGYYGCTEADIIDAIYYAAGFETVGGPGQETARAQVINMSLGGNDYCSAPIQSAIAAASSRGVIVVAAAGNSGEDATLHSPANCEDVVTVGASNDLGARSGFSNYGPLIDVMAPGEGILSTYYGDGYASLNGTSMAAPHIAGLVALLKDINPTLRFDSVLELLETGAKAVNCSGGSGCGAGLVDAKAAVAAAIERPDDPPAPVVVVQAVNTGDPSKVYHTVALEGAFELIGLPAGEYRIRAFEDLDGDFAPEADSETAADAAGTVTVTGRGEDFTGVEILLP